MRTAFTEKTKIILALFLSRRSSLFLAQQDVLKKVQELLDLTIEKLLNISLVTTIGSEQEISATSSIIMAITRQQIKD